MVVKKKVVTVSSKPKTLTANKVKPARVQTAEGWKRMVMREKVAKKKK